MKINRASYFIVLLSYTCMSSAAFFDTSQAHLIQTKQEFPWTAFFRSLYARKELSLGKFPIQAVIDGYVVHEPFWDTRQIVGQGNGLALFTPRRKDIGTGGKDKNADGCFSMSPIATRMRVRLYGPTVLGAETFGLISADFFDTGDLLTRMRNRLAYMKLTWKEEGAHVILGQFYHPIRLAHLDLDPKVLSKNRGAPIHPDIRTTQMRFSKGWPNKLNLVLTALTELRPPSLGPLGATTKYLRHSLMPAMNVQLWVGPMDTDYVFGVGFDIKRLIPRLVTDQCVRTREPINSVAFNVFSKITAEPLSIRTQFAWVQNGADYRMLGGYAVSSIDPLTDKQTYTNISVLSYWVDFNLDKKISPGLFGGITKNLGTGEPIILPASGQIPGTLETLSGTLGASEPSISESTVFALGPEIKYMAKVSPRIRFHFKPVILGAELEWTRTGFGTLKRSGKIEDVESVSNVRLLLASYFFF